MESVKQRPFLPYGRQLIDEADIEAVVQVLKSDYLTTGPSVQAFEQALSKRFNANYVVSVNSGTAALHLAMLALGIKEGDWVIVPAITFLATANAARLCGAEVLFADVDPDNGLMRVEDLNQAIRNGKNKNIKLIAPVHLAGQTEHLSEIKKIADQQNMFVVEDACHAIGTIYDDGENCYPIGRSQHSDASAFSFHPVKTIAMGEGGAVSTQQENLYQRVLKLRNHGMNRDRETLLHIERATSDSGLANGWYYEMADIGLNYRASDMNCALGLSQLQKLDRFVEKRRELARYYDQLLQPLSHLVRPIKKTPYCKPSWHLYVVLIDFEKLGLERAYVMQALRQKNIGTQVHYIPVNEQPYYQNRYGYTVLPGAKQYYKRALSLPLFPSMTTEDVGYVVDVLKNILEGA